jgi:hypothetical protein
VAKSTAGTGAVNPADDKTKEDVNAGIKYALLYKQGELYKNIDSNDKNLRLIQNDLALFARTTMSKFGDQKSLIGFTFDEKFSQDKNTFTHSGYFYGVPDKINLTATLHDSGIVTLSIKNTRDNTSIDELLNLNGEKNRFITKLPIDTNLYSVRYSRSDDKIVAAFYKGYSENDIDAVVKILNEGYGGSFKESDVIFNINAVGIFSLDEVRNYATSIDNTL